MSVVLSDPISDVCVVICTADVIVTSVESVYSVLFVVLTTDVCDESTAVEEDCEAAESFFTAVFFRGSAFVESILFIGEVFVELLNEVIAVIIASVPVLCPAVDIVCIDGVIFTSLEDVNSVLSIV